MRITNHSIPSCKGAGAMTRKVKDGAPEGYKKMPKFDGSDNDDSVEGHRK